jgi:glycerate-2-kinase
MWIQNRTQLLSHGNVQHRRSILDIIEAGLDAGDPYTNAKKLLHIKDGLLSIGCKDFDRMGESCLTYDLSQIGNIYVLGGGKAAQRMAKGIEDVLGDRITGGAISAKKGEKKYLKHIEVTLASHPIPDEDSHRNRSESSKRRSRLLCFIGRNLFPCDTTRTWLNA